MPGGKRRTNRKLKEKIKKLNQLLMHTLEDPELIHYNISITRKIIEARKANGICNVDFKACSSYYSYQELRQKTTQIEEYNTFQKFIIEQNILYKNISDYNRAFFKLSQWLKTNIIIQLSVQ